MDVEETVGFRYFPVPKETKRQNVVNKAMKSFSNSNILVTIIRNSQPNLAKNWNFIITTKPNNKKHLKIDKRRRRSNKGMLTCVQIKQQQKAQTNKCIANNNDNYNNVLVSLSAMCRMDNKKITQNEPIWKQADCGKHSYLLFCLLSK